MNLQNLVGKILEDTTGGMVGPVSNMGNPSIQYLPGQFSTMKNILRGLAVLKKKWKLEILEKGGEYHIGVEDVMNIIVPKMSYKEFNERVYDVITKKHLFLDTMIYEAQVEEIEILNKKVDEAIRGKLLLERAIAQTITIRNAWLNNFPIHTDLKLPNSTIIDLKKYNEDVAQLLGNIKEIYKDDVGRLEMLLGNLERADSLSKFEPFSESINLIGAKIQSDYRGVNLIFEAEVDMSKTPTQSIIIDSEAVLEDIAAHKIAKVVGNTLYPKGTMFSPFMFRLIKDTIKDLEK